jgi:N-acetylmuramoyl-L-alanine amidase
VCSLHLEIAISNGRSERLLARVDGARPSSFGRSARSFGKRLAANRRVVRYSLVACNVVLLAAILWFTLGKTHPDEPLGQQGVLSVGDDSAAEPLDLLSSADIAKNAAIATALPEATAVTNQADSVKAEQTIAPADTTVVSKPLAVATPLKSRKDIKDYVVQSGDTVASIASKFSVTSDSIMWSNNLRSNTINAGLKLVIPPIDGIVYVVRGGDTVDSLAQKYRANKDQIIDFNDIELVGLKVGEQILIPNGQLPAPVLIARPIQALGGYNGYDIGFCTWYVANRRAQYGNSVPANLGNASSWDNRATAMGMRVDKNPAVGAVAVTSQRGAGHVAFVEAVNGDGSIWISEMNSSGQVSMTDSRPAGGWGRIDWKLVPAGTAAGFNYIH